MKLKLYSKEEAENSIEDQLFLRLIPIEGNETDIALRVCDKNGKPITGGTILIIDQDLQGIIICQDLNEFVPLKTDFDDIPLFMTQIELSKKRNLEVENNRNDMMHSISEGLKKKIEEEINQSCSKH